MSAIIRYLRAENDPEVIAKGPSPLSAAERLGKGLGWFSLALGAAELFGGRRIADALGLEGKSRLVRLFGIREAAAGMLILSADRQTGLWSRVGGDVMDILLLGTALDAPTTRQRTNAKLALAAVDGVTVLDLIAASAVSAERRRSGEPRDFRQRSGFPRGVNAARGGAKDFTVPRNMRADIEAVR
jgi:hypothetical protein